MVDSKEQFVRKMSDIRTRSLVESENIAADQVRTSVNEKSVLRTAHSAVFIEAIRPSEGTAG
jgi:hypothetical protein